MSAHVTFVVEGVEDALAAHMAFPSATIIAALSVSRISELPSIAGKVIIIRDGDAEGSQTRKTVVKGVDHLLLDGTEAVLLTPTPDGQDPNSLLKEGGVDALRDLVAKAKPQKLSLDGEAKRLAALDGAAYDSQRMQVAKAHGVRVSTLDSMVEQQRSHAGPSVGDDDDDGGIAFPNDPWPDPIDDIAAVLDTAVAEIRRYIHTDSDDDYFVIAIWALHSHFIHHPGIKLQVSPRLAFEAAAPECGKTTALEAAVECLSARGMISGDMSAPSFFRTVDAHGPTVGIDEGDALLKARGMEHLQAILRASHRRSSAWVLRLDEVTDRKGNRTFRSRRFSTWCALAYTTIGPLKDTAMQSRAMTVRLPRALAGEIEGHLENGYSPVLDECRRKMARWSQDRLPRAALPRELFNRAGDNWRPLIELAHLAGGEWRARITQAALTKVRAEAVSFGGGELAALLMDIQKVLGGRDRLTTRELVSGLLGLDEDASRDWSIVNRRRPLDQYWLRGALAGVLNPPRSQKWKTGGKMARGYSNQQLQDAFSRYLPSAAAETPSSPDPQKPSAPSATEAEKSGKNKALRSGGSTGRHPPPAHTAPQHDVGSAVADAVADRAKPSATGKASSKQVIIGSVGNWGRKGGEG